MNGRLYNKNVSITAAETIITKQFLNAPVAERYAMSELHIGMLIGASVTFIVYAVYCSWKDRGPE